MVSAGSHPHSTLLATSVYDPWPLATQILLVSPVPWHSIGSGSLRDECREHESCRTVPETSAEFPLCHWHLASPQGASFQATCSQPQVVGYDSGRSEQVACTKFPTQDGQHRLGSTDEVPMAYYVATGGMTQSRGNKCMRTACLVCLAKVGHARMYHCLPSAPTRV